MESVCTYPLQKSCGTSGKRHSGDTGDTMEMMALGWEEFKLISVRERERSVMPAVQLNTSFLELNCVLAVRLVWTLCLQVFFYFRSRAVNKKKLITSNR